MITFEELLQQIQEQRQKMRLAEEQFERERAKMRALVELLREKSSD